jgi:hypothetical protein
MIDTITMMAIVALFNIEMVNFISVMNDSFLLAANLLISNNEGIDHFSESYQTKNNLLNESLDKTAFYHDLVMFIIIACYLNAPLNLIARFYLVRKTNRTKFSLSFDDYLNLVFSITIVIWVQ